MAETIFKVSSKCQVHLSHILKDTRLLNEPKMLYNLNVLLIVHVCCQLEARSRK